MTAASAPSDLPFLPRGSVVLAPLSGYGDLPFRRVLRGFGLRYAFAPMMDASALSIGAGRTIRIADRGKDEDWFGIQIVGNEPDKIEAATRRALDLTPTVIDLNLGCPAPKVRKKGQGCAMLGYPDLVRECVAAMTRVTSSARATVASSSRDGGPPQA